MSRENRLTREDGTSEKDELEDVMARQQTQGQAALLGDGLMADGVAMDLRTDSPPSMESEDQKLFLSVEERFKDLAQLIPALGGVGDLTSFNLNDDVGGGSGSTSKDDGPHQNHRGNDFNAFPGSRSGLHLFEDVIGSQSG